ncbi:hypothetical protein BJ912DRAFT_1150425 [Pholiota molesta]|nr:hypothetical protein BJ912DRAFT_1150425 [Pholiota molesta]
MTNSLSGVPEELKIKILSFLDAVALARCSMTCKSICETIKNSSLLAYTIQLHLNGLKDAGVSAPHADLLAHLLRYRQAWLSLKLGEPVTLWLPYDGYKMELVRAAFAHTNTEHIAHIISIPTPSNIEKRTFQNAGKGTLVLTFTMDPTQDMIALLYNDETRPSRTDARNICIHIRTMSTDIPHPLAHSSCLTITIYPNPTLGNYPDHASLYVAHNILAFTFFDPLLRRRVMIWDWTTSDLILDSSIALDPWLPPVRNGYRFGLIDHMHCLFISPVDSGSIRLYKYVRPSGVHLATLHLPPISAGISVLGVTAQAGSITAQQATPHVPLAVNDADRLHVFNLLYRKGTEGPQSTISTNVFVHQRVFMSYIAHAADPAAAGPPLDVPWADWGPRNTRILCPAYTTTGRGPNRCVHGQRVVQFPRTTERELGGAQSVEVLDFSRAAVLAAQGLLPQPPSSPTHPPGVLAPPSIVRHPYFQGDVETHLPYVSWTRELPRQYNDFLTNEDCIIGIQNKVATTVRLDIYTI